MSMYRNGTRVVAVEWTLCILSALLQIARLWVRRKLVMVKWQAEDVILLSAQLLFFAWISCDTYDSQYGIFEAKNSYRNGSLYKLEGTDAQKISVLKTQYASSAPYFLSTWLVKLSLIRFYYRMILKGMKMRIFLNAVTAFWVASLIVVILMNLLLCQPVNLNWSLDPGNVCYSSTAMVPFVVSISCNFALDVLVLICPLPVLATLKNVTVRQKWGLIGAFSLGIITILVMVARTIYLALNAAIAGAAMLTAVEYFTSTVVVSLPSMRILLKKSIWKKKIWLRRRPRASMASVEGSTSFVSSEQSDDDDDDQELADSMNHTNMLTDHDHIMFGDLAYAQKMYSNSDKESAYLPPARHGSR